MDVLAFFTLIALLIVTGLMLGRLNTLEAALRGLDERFSDSPRLRGPRRKARPRNDFAVAPPSA
ncbi:hypothetical protein [Pseudorhodoplanes sp.]|uniref:hypothetical protein n=1 Tax=Pseudorhodoplanes sp. TaxID=1934341 RepID=UPI002C002282|nr:hypothetical protein [Pseudorhodoplanes sp.]HWV52391.1 hypothetical protein [Pseudorhodoplanes sp.]